jgi:UPF0271 protein
VEYVLDTTALLSGRQFAGDLITVSGVLRELKRQGITANEESFVEQHVRIFAPSAPSSTRVAEAAEGTGDRVRLSPTDQELLALALERHATLVTDDYSIQNVARVLGVPFLAVMERGITEVRQWHLRCTGCGEYFQSPVRECPVCGSAVKTTRRPPD